MYYSKFMFEYKIRIQDRVRYNLYFFRYNFLFLQLQTYFADGSKNINFQYQKQSWCCVNCLETRILGLNLVFSPKVGLNLIFSLEWIWILVQKSWMIKGFVMFSAKIHKADGPFEWQERLDSCQNQAVFHWHHGNLLHSRYHKIRNHG